MPSRHSLAPLAALVFLLPAAALAGSAEADWKAVTDLDAGPRSLPATQQQVRGAAVAHLAAQERAVRAFLAAHPGDEHAFEAKMRLARLLQIRAGMESTEPPRVEARKILDELSRTATGEQRVEVDFALITYQMRLMKTSSSHEREQLLTATRRFQVDHPSDRRLPRLLAEVSHLFDAEPETKRSLLLGAQAITQDPDLKARIADDLKRLDLLGKPVELRINSTQGKTIDLEESRGKVVALVYFADWSPPSIDAITALQKTLKDFPKERVELIAIDLDNKLEEAAAAINKYSIACPVGFDGRGWESPAVRGFGINTLPTVWLLDQGGVLRSLNGLEATSDQVRKLLRGTP